MQLNVMSLNIPFGQIKETKKYEQYLGELILRHNVDFIFLCELLGEVGQVERLAKISSFPYWGEIPSYPHNSPKLALGFLSQYEPSIFEKIPIFQAQKGWTNGFRVVLDNLNGGLPLNIYGAHFWTGDQCEKSIFDIVLKEFKRGNPRELQVNEILNKIDENPGSSLLIGDLNTFPYSRAYNLISLKLKDSCPLLKTFFGTYKHGGLPVRLDYIFYSPDIISQSYRSMPTNLSDHHVVFAEITSQ